MPRTWRERILRSDPQQDFGPCCVQRCGVQPGRHPAGHRPADGSAAGVGRGHRREQLPDWNTTRGSARWRSARTAPGWPPAAGRSARVWDAATGQELLGSGPRRRGDARWRSARTAPGWPPAAGWQRPGVGTRPRAGNCPSCDHDGEGLSGGVQPGRHPAGHRAATDGRAGVGRGHRAETGPAATTTARVRAVAFSPDGTRLATGSDDEGPGCGTRPPGSGTGPDATTTTRSRRWRSARTAPGWPSAGLAEASGSGAARRGEMYLSGLAEGEVTGDAAEAAGRHHAL